MALASAPINKKTEALGQLGFILHKFGDINVVKIEPKRGDEDTALVLYIDPISGNMLQHEVRTNRDSVIQAIIDVCEAIKK